MHADLGAPLWVVSSLCVAVLIAVFSLLDLLRRPTTAVELSEPRALKMIGGDLLAIGLAGAYGFAGTDRGRELIGSGETLQHSLAITVTASYIIVIYICAFGLAATVFAARVELPTGGVIGDLGPIGLAPAIAFVIAVTMGEIDAHGAVDLSDSLIGWTTVVVLLVAHLTALVVMHVQYRSLVGQRDRIAVEAPLVVALCASLIVGLWIFLSS